MSLLMRAMMGAGTPLLLWLVHAINENPVLHSAMLGIGGQWLFRMFGL